MKEPNVYEDILKKFQRRSGYNKNSKISKKIDDILFDFYDSYEEKGFSKKEALILIKIPNSIKHIFGERFSLELYEFRNNGDYKNFFEKILDFFDKNEVNLIGNELFEIFYFLVIDYKFQEKNIINSEKSIFSKDILDILKNRKDYKKDRAERHRDFLYLKEICFRLREYFLLNKSTSYKSSEIKNIVLDFYNKKK